jgi:hypothetical protein
MKRTVTLRTGSNRNPVPETIEHTQTDKGDLHITLLKKSVKAYK